MKKNSKIAKRIVIVLCIVLLVPMLILSGVLYKGKSEFKKAEKASLPDTILLDGKKYQYRDELINVLCLGVDRDTDLERYDVSGNVIKSGQSDGIFLLSIDPKAKKIRIIAVPRDTMTYIEVYDEEGTFEGSMEAQITLQYAYADGVEQSCELMEQRVSELLGGIPIQHYAAVNLRAISRINDAVGGVEVTMDADYTDIDETFAAGSTVRLFGEQAMKFVRTRDTNTSGSAYTRMGRQKQYLKAFMKQAQDAAKADIKLPSKLLKALDKDLLMNLSKEEIAYMVSKALGSSFSEEDVYILQGEIVQGEIYEEYYLDQPAVQQKMRELFYKEL